MARRKALYVELYPDMAEHVAGGKGNATAAKSAAVPILRHLLLLSPALPSAQCAVTLSAAKPARPCRGGAVWPELTSHPFEPKPHNAPAHARWGEKIARRRVLWSLTAPLIRTAGALGPRCPQPG